jgi:alpha-methylacyl-CoA racemase
MEPLLGLRVLDFSRLLPGPMCSWYLRGMGAEVIKIESPSGGDPLRNMPPMNSSGVGAWFEALNAGTRSVALDVREPAGLEAARALIGASDVVLEGFRPGVMKRLGLDPSQLIEEHPRLIVASITGYGQEGSWRERPGHDLGYLGLSGLLAMNRRGGSVPSPLSAQVADIGGGSLTAAMAILGALLEREKSGRGQWLDISMSEGALSFALPWYAGSIAEGRSPRADEHPLGGALPQYRCYRCEDGGVIAVASLEPKFLMDLCGRLERGPPSDESEWEALFASRPRDVWLDLLSGCCVTPVIDFDEVETHPVHLERQSVIRRGDRPWIVPPVGSATDFVGTPAPRLGEHTVRELADVGIDWPPERGSDD